MGVTTKLYYGGTQVGQDISSDQLALTYSSANRKFEYGASHALVDEVVSEVDSSYTTTDGRLVVDIDDVTLWEFKGTTVEVSNTNMVGRLGIAVDDDHRVFEAFYPSRTQTGYRVSWLLTDMLAPPVTLKVVVKRV